MARFDRKNVPPSYPKADAGAPARRRLGKALTELRTLQRNPLTQAKFNLYTWYGRLYLGLIFAVSIGMAIICVQMFLERRPRLWDEWVMRIVAPVVPVILPTIMCIFYFKHRRIHRLSHNLCPNCGYDLRASAERCPECGHVS